ncbi:hypothetical protein BKA56DRAFT_579251 [Ilyonectria sp. MPI-CAGE-AT-0026]|nr:hypothetical protein BKA56DRAFT_579251 [Ilyonectria sp. MPI-CAGE-AT-0026]
MAKFRRSTDIRQGPNSSVLTMEPGLSESFRQRRYRTLPAIAERVAAWCRSILGRKMASKGSGMSDHQSPAKSSLSMRSNPVQKPSGADIAELNEPGELLASNGTIQRCSSGRDRMSDDGTATSLDMSCEPSTGTIRETINWVYQQPTREDLTHHGVQSPPHALIESSGGAAETGDDLDEEGLSGDVSPHKTFETQRRGIFAFRIPTMMFAPENHSTSTTDLDMTVGVGVENLSTTTSVKKRSSPATPTTLTSAASPKVLDEQSKRIRFNSTRARLSVATTRSNRRSSITPGRLSTHRSLLLTAPQTSACTVQDPLSNSISSCGTQALLPSGIVSPERRDKRDSFGAYMPVAKNVHNARKFQDHLLLESQEPMFTINGRALDAGSTETAPFRSSGNYPLLGHVSSEDNRGQLDRRGSESQTSETPSVSAFSSAASTSESGSLITSIEDLSEMDQPTQDITDNDDGTSDITEHTDLSLIEAFEASQMPFDPVLLSVLMSLKDEVVDRVKRKLELMWLQAHGTRQHPSNQASSSLPSSEQNGESTEKTSPRRDSTTYRKRPLSNDEDGDAAGGRDDDDGERRKRKDTALRSTAGERLRKFACPFCKRYPKSENLQKSCYGPGWNSVHRVKEHIYRRHQKPTYRCTRCLVSFEKEEDLIEHTRAEQRCENQTVSTEEETIYISQAQERALRKRLRNVPEEERWVLVFQILFPDVPVNQIPSPYYDIDSNSLALDLATLDEFRTFLVQELPARIVNDVNNHFRVLPEGSVMHSDMTWILRDTIQEAMEEFLHGPAPHDVDRVVDTDAAAAPESSSRGMNTLTAGNVSTIPSCPVDMSYMYAPPWPTSQPYSAPWSLALYSDPPGAPALDLMLDGTFPTVNGVSAMPASGALVNTRDVRPGSEDLRNDFMEECLFSFPAGVEDARFSS